MDTELRIGEVARRSGVSIDTLRYYERVRLLPRSRRSSGGFRLYSADDVRVRFIKQAQELGLSLEDIKDLLSYGRRRRMSKSARSSAAQTD